MAKAMISCLLDCGVSMHHNQKIGNNSKFSIANTLIQSTLTHMIMNYKSAEFSLVTMSSSHTNNSQIEEIIPMSKTTINTLSTVQYMFDNLTLPNRDNNSETMNSISYTDGLETATDILVSVNAGKAYTRVLLFITDGESPVDKFEYLESTIVPKMKQYNCCLYVACIGSSVVPNSNNNSDNYNEIQSENAALFQSLAAYIDGKFVMSTEPGELYSLLSNVPGLSTTPRAAKINLFLSPEVKVPCQYFALVSKSSLPSLKKCSKSTGSTSIDGDGDGDEVVGNPVKRDTSYRNPNAPDEEIQQPELKVKGYKYGSQYVPFNTIDESLFKVPGPCGLELINFISYDSVSRFQFLGVTMVLQGDSRLVSAQIMIGSLIRSMKKLQKVALVRFVKKDDADPFLAVLMPHTFSADGSGAEGSSCDDGTLLVHQLPCVEDVRELEFPPLSLKGTSVDPTVYPSVHTSTASLPVPVSVPLQTLDEVISSMTVTAAIPPTKAFLPPFNYTTQNIRMILRQKAIGTSTKNANNNTSSNSNSNSSSNNSSSGSDRKEAPFQDTLNPTFVATEILSIHPSKLPELQSRINQLAEFYHLKPNIDQKVKKRQRTYWSDSIALSEGQTHTGPTGPTCASGDESLQAKRARGQVKVFVKDEEDDENGVDIDKTHITSSCSGEVVEYDGPTLSLSSFDPDRDFRAVVTHLLQLLLDHSATATARRKHSDADAVESLVKRVLQQNIATLQDIVIQTVTKGSTVAHYRKAVVYVKTYRWGCLQLQEPDSYNQFMRTVIKPSFRVDSPHTPFWELLKQDSEQTTLICTDDSMELKSSPSGGIASAATGGSESVEWVYKGNMKITELEASSFYHDEELSEDRKIVSDMSPVVDDDDFFADLA